MSTAATEVQHLRASRVGTLPLVSWFLNFCRTKPLGAFGLIVLVFLLLLALFAPWVTPYPYDQIDISQQLQSSSWAHPFGTDNLGRDVLSRLIVGARVSMFVGMGAVAVSMAIAMLLGTMSGYFGGKLDLVGQRFIDVWMAFPGIVLLITILTMFEPGQAQVTVAIGILLAAGASRVVRASVLETRSQTYVEAARAVGAKDLRILSRHIVPNIFGPIMVIATTQLGLAILLEATLSFLGYGVPPPEPSWGSMLGADVRKDILAAPMQSVWPGLAIFLAVFSFNVLGDALRDAFDPRLRGSRG